MKKGHYVGSYTEKWVGVFVLWRDEF
jgi:hypothetical protein